MRFIEIIDILLFLMTYPTLILRHCRENLKKCSLRGLEDLEGFIFLTYPKDPIPSLGAYVMLDLEGEELTEKDQGKGLFLIDATWAYAKKMVKHVTNMGWVEKRSLPKHFRTAYPRRQKDCIDPERGLASIEAIAIAFMLLGKPWEHLLDGYYWKKQFLNLNRDLCGTNFLVS